MFLDIIFLIYFVTHIPITIFIDLQGLLPQSIFPKFSVDLLEWYCAKFKDALMADPPVWFQSFVCCEMLFQFPFFFVATYAFMKGIQNCKWIRIPMIVYGSHVATTTFCIIAHVLLHDFKDSRAPGPVTLEERLKLIGIYSAYFVIPILLVIRMAFGSEFSSSKIKQKRM